MLPKVIIHNEMSLDGRFDWMLDDSGLYYETIGRFQVDAMLSGSNTMLEALEHMQPSEPTREFIPAAKNFSDDRQLLVVVDSQGRISNWSTLRDQPYWRDVVVLCSQNTPKTYLEQLGKEQIETIIAGQHKVDFRVALEKLHEDFQVEKLRVDTGGILNGVLLRAGLVDEIAVILNPCLTGGISARTLFVAEDLFSRDDVIPLALKSIEKLRNDYLWLQYEILPIEDSIQSDAISSN